MFHAPQAFPCAAKELQRLGHRLRGGGLRQHQHAKRGYPAVYIGIMLRLYQKKNPCAAVFAYVEGKAGAEIVG